MQMPNDERTAPFRTRMVAEMIDAVVPLLILLPVLLFMFGQDMWSQTMQDCFDGDLGLMCTTFLILLAFAYTMVEAATGASPGKRLLGLRIVRADGKRENWSFFLWRWILKRTLIQFTFGLECLRSLQKDGQTFHDFLAHSQVVFSEKRT